MATPSYYYTTTSAHTHTIFKDSNSDLYSTDTVVWSGNPIYDTAWSDSASIKPINITVNLVRFEEFEEPDK